MTANSNRKKHKSATARNAVGKIKFNDEGSGACRLFQSFVMANQ